jgi:hypothetical protein
MKKGIVIVDDVAGLRELWPIRDKDLARVESSDDDYKYDATSLAEDDGDLVVKPDDRMTTQTGRWLRRRLALPDLDDALGSVDDPGAREQNILELPDVVAHEDSLTIGDDVYEVEIVNTDSTDDTADGDFNNVTNPLTLTGGAAKYSGVTFTPGLLIRVENEIMRVVTGGANPVLSRAQSGTTVATHANGQNIMIGDGRDLEASILVGLVTTLTPAAYIAALLADLEEHGTEAVSAEEIGTAAGVRFFADEVGAEELAVAEDFTEAGNVWASETFYGGRAAGIKRLVVDKRAPSACEIAFAEMVFAYTFEPVVLAVLVYVTATPGIAKAWDGTVDVVENKVILTDGGSENLEETDTVVLVLSE